MTIRKRADQLLVERRVFESRARAKAAIEAGLVRADGVVVSKASELVPTGALLRAKPEHPWASRGGVKLAAALDHFGFDPAGRICLDVGASTGGFTDVLVTRRARLVYAVDVGHDQLRAHLSDSMRVVSLEGTDIRTLDPAALPERPDFATIDVSFISLKLVLPALDRLLARPAHLIALIKPQFEVGRKNLKKGIVREVAIRDAACEAIAAFAVSLGWEVAGITPSPIDGGEGNKEFLMGARRD
jgi:23S rRNA (cytidine1920-2'-O)/16S rRNA (cytidine1409-2'-O)-methyltransferase